jgi:integrase
MEATGGNWGHRRVNVPSVVEQRVVDLTVDLVTARSGTVFGRGFRLRAIGQRLYVQVTGRKIPLHLHFDVGPEEVQKRALALKEFLRGQAGGFDSDSWRAACAVERVRTGKSRSSRLGLDEVVAKWHRLKRAEGVSESTFERHYLVHLRRLDPRQPLSDDSLLRVIEQTDPAGPTRRRVVTFLRRLCALCGAEWNGPLLDPLQRSGQAVSHRPQAFFSDDQIVAMLTGQKRLLRPWRRVLAAMAVYGLRPWEAWIVEPCRVRAGCAWVGAGKTNRHGTTCPRQVPPFHPEWVELFDLAGLWGAPTPALSDRSKAGARVNQQMRRAGLVEAGGPTAYGFRHAYARRLHSARYRVTDAHAALFMGHTVAAHHKAYRSWLGGEDPIGMYFDCPG